MADILKNISKQSGIYKFTNTVNNKCYIGQAQNLKVRIRGHLRDFKKNKYDNIYFYKSIRKHGIENFQLEILQEGNFTKQELDDMEITFIRLFKSNIKLYGYNLTIGGDGTSGFKHSEESKQKIRKVNKGIIRTEEFKEKIRQANLGKTLSEETKQKIKNGNLGKKMSQESVEKTRQAQKGKPKSEEHKQKLRQANLGKIVSEETKQKLSYARKGHLVSKETRDKIGKAHKGKIVSQETNKKNSNTRKFNKNMKLIQENNFVYDWLYL